MKEKLFTWIDNSLPLAIELETELTKRPAVSPDSGGEGELDKCLFLENWLRAHGITNLERYDAPDSRAKGDASGKRVRPNLIATIEGSDESLQGSALLGSSLQGSSLQGSARLWIMSHLDVVPPGEEKLWNSDPWTVVRSDDPPGPRLIGRGVEDNQQGIVASVLAALAFTSQGLKPARTLKLLFAADEEVGSAFGIEWLVKNHADLFKKDDMVLVPDGGDKNGEFIEIAEKNILWLKFVTKGKQTHGSRPELGANAFIAGSDLAVRLHNGLSAKFADRDPLFTPDCSTFQPTKKTANVPNINTIPGEDVFYMDMRILPCHKTDLVLAEIDRIMSEVEEKYKVKIERSTVQLMESQPTAADSIIVKSLSSAISEIYGVKAQTIGIGGGTVAAYLRNIGINCAVWTKTDQTLHQPNEYVLLSNLLGDAKVMALLAC